MSIAHTALDGNFFFFSIRRALMTAHVVQSYVSVQAFRNGHYGFTLTILFLNNVPRIVVGATKRAPITFLRADSTST